MPHTKRPIHYLKPHKLSTYELNSTLGLSVCSCDLRQRRYGVASRSPMPATVFLANALRGAMTRYRLTQEQVAPLIGVSQSHLSQMLRGTRSIDIDQYLAFCHALDINPIALLAEAIDFVSRRHPWPRLVSSEMKATPATQHVESLSDRRAQGFGDRLALAIEASGLPEEDAVRQVLRALGRPTSETTLSELTGDAGVERDAVASKAAIVLHVPSEYLVGRMSSADAERMEAELHYKRALQITGAQVAARSAGQLTTEELRALTDSIMRHGDV